MRHSLEVELTRLRDTLPAYRFRNTHTQTALIPCSFMCASEPACSQVCWIEGPMYSGTFQRQTAGAHNWSSYLNSPMRAGFWYWLQHTWKSATEKTIRWIFFGLGGTRNVEASIHVECENYCWKDPWNKDFHYFKVPDSIYSSIF